MSAGLQCRPARDYQIVREVRSVPLTEAFPNLTGNLPGRLGKVCLCKIAIALINFGRNRAETLTSMPSRSLRVNQEILQFPARIPKTSGHEPCSRGFIAYSPPLRSKGSDSSDSPTPRLSFRLPDSFQNPRLLAPAISSTASAARPLAPGPPSLVRTSPSPRRISSARS